MKYDVICQVIVTVKVPGIEADSQVEAIERARELIDPNALFNRYNPAPFVSHTEWTDEYYSFFVDEDGDEEHERTTVYAPDGKTPIIHP